MRTRTGLLAITAIAALTIAGCTNGDETADPIATPEEVVTPEEPDTTTAQECLPVPGDSLMVLDDDQLLQNSDNIIPAVGADVADDAVLEALSAVSAELDTNTLIELNQAVDIDRRTSADVASEWFADSGISITSTGSGSIVIGAANFSENITLAEIYALALEEAGYDASVRDIGNRETYLPALVDGEINVVPEYAATFAEFLNIRQNGDGAPPVASGDINETVVELDTLGANEGLVFGEAANGQNQNAFAVTEAFSAEYGVTTLSELAEACGPIVLGGPPECPERQFCQIGLEGTYGIEVAEFRSLDVGGPLTKTAIETGEIAVGLVFSSDGALG